MAVRMRGHAANGLKTWDKVFDDVHVGKRVDRAIFRYFIGVAQAGESVRSIDIHRARPADSFTARAIEQNVRLCEAVANV